MTIIKLLEKYPPVKYVDNPTYRNPGFAERMEHPPRGLPPSGPHHNINDINQYHLCQVCQNDILTREQETHLFQQLNFFRMIAANLRSKLTRRNAAAFIAATEKSVAARHTIFVHNLRLIVKFLAQHKLGISERISDATGVVLRAIDWFNWEKGNKFSTYATNSLQRALSRELRPDTINRLVKGKIGVTAFSEIRPPASWEDRCSEYVEETIGIGDVDTDSVDRDDLLGRLLQAVSPRDLLAIKLYYYGHMTYKEIGTEMQVTVSRAKQLVFRGLKKMKVLAAEKYSHLFY